MKREQENKKVARLPSKVWLSDKRDPVSDLGGMVREAVTAPWRMENKRAISHLPQGGKKETIFFGGGMVHQNDAPYSLRNGANHNGETMCSSLLFREVSLDEGGR